METVDPPEMRRRRVASVGKWAWLGPLAMMSRPAVPPHIHLQPKQRSLTKPAACTLEILNQHFPPLCFTFRRQIEWSEVQDDLFIYEILAPSVYAVSFAPLFFFIGSPATLNVNVLGLVRER